MRILCFLVLLFCSCSLNAAAIHWTRFYWDSGKKGAMFIPLKFDKLRTTYWMQLDTGAGETVFYQVPFDQLKKPLGLSDDPNARWLIGLSIGDYHFADFVRYDRGLHEQMKFGDPIAAHDPHPIIGSVGAEIFDGHVVLLDFLHERFSILDGDTVLPKVMMSKATFIPLKYDRKAALIYLPVSINDKSYPDSFFFDSGSSAMDINVAKRLWQRLTGLNGDEKEVKKVPVSAWGTQELMGVAPIKGELQIGPVRKKGAAAYTTLKGRSDADVFAGGHALGLIGNAPFYHHWLLIFDMPHNRLGFIREN